MARWKVKEIAAPERWTARKLAIATGLAYGTVYHIWRNEAKRADLSTLDAIAQVLGVQPGDLLGPDPPDGPGLRPRKPKPTPSTD